MAKDLFETVKIADGIPHTCARCGLTGDRVISQEGITGDIIESCPFCGHEI